MTTDPTPRPHAPEHSAMDVVDELGIAARVHDEMTEGPSGIAFAIRRGIAEIERLRAEVAARTESGQIACLADIREAVGDPTGKLMQDELVALVRELAELRRRVAEALPATVSHHAHLGPIALADTDCPQLYGKRVRLLPEEVNDGQE
jgi:hypothetical protein